MSRSSNGFDLKKMIFDLREELAILRSEIMCHTVGEPSSMPFDDLLDKIDYISISLSTLESHLTPTIPPPEFYPTTGTVFLDSASYDMRPMFVEDKKDRADDSRGVVAFYDRTEGMGDYANWLDDVKIGKLKILWCPSYGRVFDNQDYLTHWHL